MKSTNKKLPLILLLALILRLIAIASRPLWYDEAFAVLLSSSGPSGMVYGTLTPDAAGNASNIHPLGFFFLLWVWMTLFGQSAWVIRSLSILFGMGIVILTYYLAKKLFDNKTGAVSALFVAISPFQIHYAQEVRMYAPLTFFLLGCTYALFVAMGSQEEKKSWIWWGIFSFLAACAQYTHNLAGQYLILLALTPLLLRKLKNTLKVFLAGIGAIILYSPWLIHLPSQFSKVQQSFWTQKPEFSRLFSTLLTFFTNLPIPESWLPYGLFISLFVFSLAGWQTYKAFRDKVMGYKCGLWMAYLTIAPPILIFIISQWAPVYIERALLPSGVTMMIWLGWVITSTRLPKPLTYLTTVLVIVGAAMGFTQHLTYRGFPYGPYKELGEFLSTEVSQEDIIIHSNKLTMLPMVYYHPALNQEFVADLSGSSSDIFAIPTQKALNLMASPSVEDAVDDAPRIWFIIFQKAIDEYHEFGFDTHPHLTWLDAHYQLENVDEWDEIRLFTFIGKQ